MYFEPYENERDRRWTFAVIAGAAAVVLLLSVVVVGQLRSGGDGDDSTAVSVPTDTTAEAPASSPTTTSSRTEATRSTASSTIAAESVSTASTTPVDTATPGTDADAAPTTASSTTAAATESELGYPTSPDGTPLPIVVIFDVETITMTGQVPSEAARERLVGLAIANSQFPDAQVVDNMVVNPAVPISVGVRVIELNSARFPEASAEILPAHAEELNRVVAIMQALPNISVLVVGHADQRGDDVTNFAISDERARAVVNYLLYLGIAQTRLASRAAGESDLLTLGDDEASLALNRRTEFIFYGLLIE